MNDWLHEMPVLWMVVFVFGGTTVAGGVIYAAVIGLAKGERAPAFKGISPGMLPPLGILFGLFVAFTAAQVWTDNQRAGTAVNQEASALSIVLFMAANFPPQTDVQIRGLIRDYIQQTVTEEWPQMAEQSAHLRITPQALIQALKADFDYVPTTASQQTAQREIASALESALDARRLRIQVSKSEVSPVKWACMLIQALCMLIAVAMVHFDKRRTAAIAMALFGAGVAISIVIIVSHDRPFAGEISIGPSALLHVMPEIASVSQ